MLNATGPRTLRFLPPLVVSEAEIADALGRLGALLGLTSDKKNVLDKNSCR